MKIVKSIMTKNPCYKANKEITVKGLMLHSVGCPQPKAKVFISSTSQLMIEPAYMVLLMLMMVQYTKL